MDSNKINQAAEILYKSRTLLKKIAKLPNDCMPQNKDEAYLIQNSLIKKYLSMNKGSSIIGKKVGCTNKAAQMQINVNEPFYGNILSHYSSKSNSIIESKNFFSPFIEPEFSFRIKESLDISKAPYSSDEIFNSIHSVLPSIELVDSRFDDWTSVGINNLIADNGVNAYWIYGEEIHELQSFNFADHPVILFVNDKVIDRGNSKNVLENPVNSLTWLINTLAIQGKSLPTDSYISTGTCTPAIPLNINDNVCADFGKLGQIKFNYI